jgi:hypothetical protein
MMSSEFRICRICLIDEDDDELIPIYEKDSEIATKIFFLSGTKVNNDNRANCSHS